MSTIPPAPSPGRRNAYIDTLRGWSIFGVICEHFAGSFVTTDIHAWSPSFFVGLILNQVFCFAVPIFLFLSGFLAGASKKTVTLGDYYRGRLWRIGFPYLLASIASFFLLNHYPEWLALPSFGDRLIWLFQKLCFYGVEPTLYFIPLIIQLYFLQPALKALPHWFNRLLPRISSDRFVAAITLLLLAIHVYIGVQCNRGHLNYYVWGRPNVIFWAVYFFAGLHFRSLIAGFSPRGLRLLGGIALAGAVGAMAWNFHGLLNRAVVGVHFEFNRLDFAYVRPEMLLYDLTIVTALAVGIALGWAPRAGVACYLGRYTLEIYIWHILVLYYGAWRYADVLASCRQIPELIVLICASAALFIAGISDGLSRLRSYTRHHRIAIVKVP